MKNFVKIIASLFQCCLWRHWFRFMAWLLNQRLIVNSTFRDKRQWNFMMASSNGNIFCVTDPLCGNSPATGEFPSQRPVTRSFGVFFDRWIHNRDVCDLRRHRAHYDVTTMWTLYTDFHSDKVYLKMPSVRCWPFCSGLTLMSKDNLIFYGYKYVCVNPWHWLSRIVNCKIYPEQVSPWYISDVCQFQPVKYTMAFMHWS